MYQMIQFETPQGTILFCAPSQCSLGTAYDAASAFKSHIEKLIEEQKESTQESDEKEG